LRKTLLRFGISAAVQNRSKVTSDRGRFEASLDIGGRLLCSISGRISLLGAGQDIWHAECVYSKVKGTTIRRTANLSGSELSEAKEIAMRKIILGLVGLGMLFGSANAAMAHGWGHRSYYHRPVAHAYRPVYRYGAGYAPAYGPAYGVGYGPGCGVGYGAGYGGYGVAPYTYPPAGIGVGTRNFSFWLAP